MRLFIATPVPEQLKEKAAAVSKEIEQDGIRNVKPQNMHVTLRFIGEVTEEQADGIRESLKQVKFSSFGCSLRGVGAFPDENYVRVIWAGIESDGKLEELAKKVDLAVKGMPGDGKFAAHLTLARVKKKVDVRSFLEKHKGDDYGSFTVSTFELIKSVLQPGGPEYTVIESYGAGDA